MIISVAKDFSRFPSGRTESDGHFSGEAFRKKLLIPALKNGEDVIVNLDGTLGIGSSWLQAAFSSLFSDGELSKHAWACLEVRCKDKSMIKEVWEYIDGK
jgi:hypothetical protein